MAFKLTKETLAKSGKCPVGMFIATLTEVEDTYTGPSGCEVQKCNFETDKGYNVPKWFNDSDMGMAEVIGFVQAADNVTFTQDNLTEGDIELKNYIGKKVAIAVSHQKDKQGKLQANIDEFYSSSKVPF